MHMHETWCDLFNFFSRISDLFGVLLGPGPPQTDRGILGQSGELVDDFGIRFIKNIPFASFDVHFEDQVCTICVAIRGMIDASVARFSPVLWPVNPSLKK